MEQVAEKELEQLLGRVQGNENQAHIVSGMLRDGINVPKPWVTFAAEYFLGTHRYEKAMDIAVYIRDQELAAKAVEEGIAYNSKISRYEIAAQYSRESGQEARAKSLESFARNVKAMNIRCA